MKELAEVEIHEEITYALNRIVSYLYANCDEDLYEDINMIDKYFDLSDEIYGDST